MIFYGGSEFGDYWGFWWLYSLSIMCFFHFFVAVLGLGLILGFIHSVALNLFLRQYH